MSNPLKVLATVKEIRSFGTGVYQVDFSVPVRFNRFIPGQFLHLTLDEFDPSVGYWPESRVFSIASEPKLDTVSVVYSVKGTYTKRMEAELKVGKEIWLKYPYGDFIIDNHATDGKPVVLIAGGTGVSPYMPYLLKSSRDALAGNVTLYYGVREPAHMLFEEQFRQVVGQQAKFKLYMYLEQGQKAGFVCRNGRLNIDDIKADSGEDFGGSVFFLSGPPVMIKKFKADLLAAGISQDQIKIDEWE
jgi:ferredoxin-NADP reductase